MAAQRQGDPRHIGEILVEVGELAPADVVDTLAAQGDARPSMADNNIPVDVGQLDKLMNLVGELVLARNQILQFTTNQTDGGGLVDAGLVSTSQRLNLMEPEEEVAAADIADAVGELVNIVAGGVKQRLQDCAGGLRLGLPVFIHGYVQPTQQLEVSPASVGIGAVDAHLMALRSTLLPSRG